MDYSEKSRLAVKTDYEMKEHDTPTSLSLFDISPHSLLVNNITGGGGLVLFGNKYPKKTNNLTSTFLEGGGGGIFYFLKIFSRSQQLNSQIIFPACFARIKFLNNVVLLSYHIQCVNEYIPL